MPLTQSRSIVGLEQSVLDTLLDTPAHYVRNVPECQSNRTYFQCVAFFFLTPPRTTTSSQCRRRAWPAWCAPAQPRVPAWHLSTASAPARTPTRATAHAHTPTRARAHAPTRLTTSGATPPRLTPPPPPLPPWTRACLRLPKSPVKLAKKTHKKISFNSLFVFFLLHHCQFFFFYN